MGLFDKLGVAALQVLPQNVHAAGFDPHTGLFQVAEHSVMDQFPAQLNDLDVEIVQFPELTAGQGLGCVPS